MIGDRWWDDVDYTEWVGGGNKSLLLGSTANRTRSGNERVRKTAATVW